MSPDGEDPAAVYPHARNLVLLPAGGPHGQVFLQSELHDEYPSLGKRVKGKLGRMFGG